ncbi:MAG: GDSL-type esterase/lipase family protein [Hyphomicrobiaceae bacterium]
MDKVSSRPGLSDRSKALITAGIVVALLVALVGMAEVAVRVRQLIKYGHFGTLDQIFEVDPSNGLRVPRANAQIASITVNSRGFRGPEIDVPKKEGTTRLAFIGASTTFCAEVSSDKATWPYLVWERIAREFPQSRFDFVNGSVPGYTVSSSIRNLDLRIAPLQPDVIVIYHATNDLAVELGGIAKKQGIGENIAPPDTSWLSRTSLLWSLVTKNIRILMAEDYAKTTAKSAVQFDPAAIGEPFRANMTRLVRRAKETGAVVAVTTFSVHMRSGQDDEAKRRSMHTALIYFPGYDFDSLVKSFQRYNQIIEEVAAAEGVILVRGEETIPGDARHFVDSVHFSDEGSAAQARRVYDTLLNSKPFLKLVGQ